MYEPEEDSYLIEKHIKNYPSSSCLEIGTGSGILAMEASNYCKKILAVDIDKEAINYCKKSIKKNNIKFKISDLFSNIKGKFDLILFNPPYLPNDPLVKDKALDGGKKGYELIERFLNNVNSHLNKNGKILLIFSSLTNKKKVDSLIKKNALKFREIEKQKFFFEEIYLYLIES